MELFKRDEEKFAPLAYRLCPSKVEEIAGQKHILGADKILYRIIKGDRLPSLVLYGPPGSGKTVIARVIANSTDGIFKKMNAVTAGVSDIREASREAQEAQRLYGKRTILFVDEIHRFNKSQQDALLPDIEDGTIVFIGATTANPYYYINQALLSRCHVFTKDIAYIYCAGLSLPVTVMQQILFSSSQDLSITLE